MREISIFMLIILALVTGLVACAQPVAGEVVQSEEQRQISPDVNEAGLATLVDGNSTFAFDLYQEFRRTDGRIFYSPHSIYIALAGNAYKIEIDKTLVKRALFDENYQMPPSKLV